MGGRGPAAAGAIRLRISIKQGATWAGSTSSVLFPRLGPAERNSNGSTQGDSGPAAAGGCQARRVDRGARRPLARRRARRRAGHLCSCEPVDRRGARRGHRFAERVRHPSPVAGWLVVATHTNGISGAVRSGHRNRGAEFGAILFYCLTAQPVFYPLEGEAALRARLRRLRPELPAGMADLDGRGAVGQRRAGLTLAQLRRALRQTDRQRASVSRPFPALDHYARRGSGGARRLRAVVDSAAR